MQLMELDKETLEMIIETHNDVKHILKSLDSGAKIFKDHSERIQKLEKNEQSVKGRLSIIVKLVIGVITVAIGSVLYLWVQLASR